MIDYTWKAINICNTQDIQAGERVVSYLPLCHLASQMKDIMIPLAGAIHVYFAASDAI
jgi:long-subunit acyl-CoA synthetase (AMP-forming)